VADLDKARSDAKAALAGKTVSAVALISDRDQVLYAAKPSSYAGDLLDQLGLTNPAATQDDSGPFPGYTTMAPEKLVQYDPDFIFTISPAPAPAPKLSTIIPQIPPFKGLKAVTGNKVVEADAELFLEAPGPRADLALKALAAALTGKTN
jgi:iron complex transport system substrate-binding protein